MSVQNRINAIMAEEQTIYDQLSPLHPSNSFCKVQFEAWETTASKLCQKVLKEVFTLFVSRPIYENYMATKYRENPVDYRACSGMDYLRLVTSEVLADRRKKQGQSAINFSSIRIDLSDSMGQIQEVLAGETSRSPSSLNRATWVLASLAIKTECLALKYLSIEEPSWNPPQARASSEEEAMEREEESEVPALLKDYFTTFLGIFTTAHTVDCSPEEMAKNFARICLLQACAGHSYQAIVDL